MEKRSKLYQYAIAFLVSLASVTMGAVSSWPSVAISKFQNDKSTGFQINKTEITWMLSVNPLGFIVGSFISRFTSDKYGRRFTILASALPMTTGTVIVAMSNRVWLLYVCRILWGCATGMLSAVTPMYFAEIADKDIRASLYLISRFMFNFGGFVIMSAGPILSYRTLNYSLLVLPISYFLSCLCIPESPYYYLKDGKEDAARKELKKLRRCKNAKLIEDEFCLIQDSVKKEMQKSSSVKELVTGRQYRKAIVIATGLQILQAMTGQQVIHHYLSQIIKDSKSVVSEKYIFIGYAAFKFAAGITSSMIADRVKRKPLLYYSYIGTALSLFTVGCYFFTLEILRVKPDTLTPYSVIIFIAITSGNVISILGFSSITPIIVAEIFPLNVKAVAMTSLSTLGGILGFTIAKIYQPINDVAGLCGVFWIFGGIAILGALFSIFKVVETKGKSLSEIQRLLHEDEVLDAAEVGLGEEMQELNANGINKVTENL